MSTGRNIKGSPPIPRLILAILVCLLPLFGPEASLGGEDRQIRKIRSLVDKGKADQAIAAIMRFRQDNPHSPKLPELWLLKAHLTEEFYARVAALREVTAEFPVSVEAGRAQEELASLAYLSPDARTCARETRKFLVEHSARPGADRVLLMEANCLMASRRTDGARKVYETLVRDFPQSPFAVRARTGIAECLMAEGENERAERILLKLAQTAGADADLPRIYYDLAEVMARQGRKIQATRLYRTVTERFPDSPFAPMAQQGLSGLLPGSKQEGSSDRAP